MITETAQARVGSVLRDKWRLDGLLGVGGMAAVYEATHSNGNRAAVKLLHPQYVADAEIRKRFLHEGYVANLIEHPGAVRVLDKDDAPDGTAFLVMELLEGETLQARLDRRGRLPENEALVIAYRVLDVLAAAHARGIVHRDIKLDNVFITLAGEVKVLDFGIARLAAESSKVQVSRTARYSMLGTPAFMAPEQALGRSDEVDGQTDLWAVGAIVFKLLTGRNVHEGQTLSEQLASAATKPAPSLQTILPQTASQVAVVVNRALAYDKEDRWRDARDMQAAIRPLLGGASQSLPAVQPPSVLVTERALTTTGSNTRPFWLRSGIIAGHPERHKPPRSWPRWLVLAGAAAAVILGGWLILRQQKSSVGPGAASVVDTERAPAGRTRVTADPVSPAPVSETPPQPPVEAVPHPGSLRPLPSRPTAPPRTRARTPAQEEQLLLERRH
jgi:serine/threonine protein kinase